MKIILTKGLPASGKSTWAKEQLSNGNIVRINKDDLRAMMTNGKFSRVNEQIVLKTRDEATIAALNKGYSVIIDDTNLHSKHEQRMYEIANMYSNCTVEFKDFTDVPVEECIKRDLKRENSVGSKVIMGMYKSFLAPEPLEAPEYDPAKEDAIIVDIDGTLAHMAGRSPYDPTKYHEDMPDSTIRSIVEAYSNVDHRLNTKIVICSGRDDTYRDITEQWLKDHKIWFDKLLMRKGDDKRNDAIIKGEIYEADIKPFYNVLFVLDDRDRVVQMWRDKGLKCLQVAEGDF